MRRASRSAVSRPSPPWWPARLGRRGASPPPPSCRAARPDQFAGPVGPSAFAGGSAAAGPAPKPERRDKKFQRDVRGPSQTARARARARTFRLWSRGARTMGMSRCASRSRLHSVHRGTAVRGLELPKTGNAFTILSHYCWRPCVVTWNAVPEQSPPLFKLLRVRERKSGFSAQPNGSDCSQTRKGDFPC